MKIDRPFNICIQLCLFLGIILIGASVTSFSQETEPRPATAVLTISKVTIPSENEPGFISFQLFNSGNIGFFVPTRNGLSPRFGAVSIYRWNEERFIDIHPDGVRLHFSTGELGRTFLEHGRMIEGVIGWPSDLPDTLEPGEYLIVVHYSLGSFSSVINEPNIEHINLTASQLLSIPESEHGDANKPEEGNGEKPSGEERTANGFLLPGDLST